jgi:murein DD-endopeptidase MepM/ murein hydrolase activator NlpD
VSDLDQRLSESSKIIQDLEQRVTAAERDRDRVNAQLEEGQQRVVDLDQQLSARTDEIQGLEQRATAAERERGNVTSLYFKATNDLKQAGQRATELEQQLSSRIQETQELEQETSAAENEAANLNKQRPASGLGFIRKLLGLGGTRRERVPRASHHQEDHPVTAPDIARSKGPRLGIVGTLPGLKSRTPGGEARPMTNQPLYGVLSRFPDRHHKIPDPKNNQVPKHPKMIQY